MVVNSLRFFGMTDFLEIKRMTLVEYNLRMESYQLSNLDKQRDFHLQALINQSAKATKKNGDSKWDSFDKFFGKKYESEVRKVRRIYEGNFDKKAVQASHDAEVRQRIADNMREYREFEKLKKQQERRKNNV